MLANSINTQQICFYLSGSFSVLEQPSLTVTEKSRGRHLGKKQNCGNSCINAARNKSKSAANAVGPSANRGFWLHFGLGSQAPPPRNHTADPVTGTPSSCPTVPLFLGCMLSFRAMQGVMDPYTSYWQIVTPKKIIFPTRAFSFSCLL